MSRRKALKSMGLFTLVVIVSVFVVRPTAATLNLENVTVWYWISNTSTLSVDVGDVDGDGQAEIVTGGVYYDGTRRNAQLCVWSGSDLALETVRTWYWTDDTWIYSVAVGDVDGDDDVEIVTGGSYYDGTRDNAQLCVWDGSSLALEGVKTWYLASGAVIISVDVGDVDGDGDVEIVTGGHIDANPYGVTHAQLCVWDGSTLTLEGVKTWFRGYAINIRAVAVGDVDGDGDVEIVTGGQYHDGDLGHAELCVWDGSSLALEGVKTWYWISATYIYSVAVGDVDDDASAEIVTGGYYDDGTRNNAQLCVWDGSSLALEGVKTWYWTGDTQIWYSMGIDDVDGDGFVEIVTGGSYHDGTRRNAQLCVWSGSTLALEDVTSWYWTSHTRIFSVDVGDVDGDGSVEIVTGGSFYGAPMYAQLAVWIKT